MEKKAQVAIFMIVGILILVVFALILFISNKTTTVQLETIAAPSVETVPQEFVAIQEYTTNCLHQTAKQGAVILGQQGGYISPSTLGDFSLSNPTESIGIIMDPVQIPYWHYNALPNSDLAVSVSTFQPYLESHEDHMSIGAQLERFINEEIGSCLNDYEVFTNQAFAITASERESQVRVGPGFVDVILEMPLAATRNDATTEMKVFHTTLDVDLGHVYEIANQITSAERNFTFLETQALDLLLVYSGEDITKFPPMSGVGFNDQNYLLWTDKQIKMRMQGVLSSHVPMLQYGDSQNFLHHKYSGNSPTTSLAQQMTDNMILPLNGGQDLEVRFDYLGWEPYLNMNGGEEEIRPSNILVQFPGWSGAPFGFQKYYNSYDFSYPVLVTVSDPTSFKGEGYTFSFALEANVINNEAIRQDYVQPPVQTNRPTLLCDKNQRDTGPIRTLIVDSYTQEPLDLVSIGFSVPEIDRCEMGQTDTEGELETEYPAVIGGTMDFYVEDYLHSFLPVDTYYLKDRSAIVGQSVAGLDYEVVFLHKKKPITIKAMKKSINKCIVPKVCNLDKDKCDEYASRICFFNSGAGLFLPQNPDWVIEANGSLTFLNEFYFTNTEQQLDEQDKVVFTLDRVADVEEDIFVEEKFEQYVTLVGENTLEVDLVPGVYKVGAHLIREEAIVFSEDLRCADATQTKNCANITSMSVESVVSPLEWNTQATYFTITADDLYNSDTLTLYALQTNFFGLPEKVTSFDEDGDDIQVNSLVLEDLGMMGYSTNISRMPHVRSALEPVWSIAAIE